MIHLVKLKNRKQKYLKKNKLSKHNYKKLIISR